MFKFVDPVYYPPAPWYPCFDYLVVIDFEATCDDNKNDNPSPIRLERPEIIQFPAILLNVHTLQVVGQFNSLVRPVEAPVLSKFCTSLTGITQSMVDEAPTFPEVLVEFEEWLRSFKIAVNEHESGHSFAIVTDGSYDMGHFLYKQCIISQVPYPAYATRWVNIRTIFTRAYRYRIRWVNLKAVLDLFDIPFKGRAHNGLDDSANICTILQLLLKYGCNAYQTERILLQTEEQEWNAKRILSDRSAGRYDLATVAPVGKECVYLYPSGMYGYSLDGYAFKSTMSMNTVDYSHHQSVASISSSSCESIASDCSNKENSIPTMYIPSKVSSETKSRATTGNKDTTINVSCGTAASASSSRRFNKKKKNSQLKNSGGANLNGCLKNGSKVGTDSDSDSSQLQSNKLVDPHGSSLSHLQPLIVSELTSSRKV
ncbi:unnamed protein product [Orchesella dallaii]|uniref:Exonuclease domain-containing protein n=1 Tax=Orchesella dallaii TaxID=48710 RepID=A0ABP1QZ41_9HEXA